MNTITVKPVLVKSKESTDLIICAVDKWLFKTEHYGSAFSSVLGEDKYQQLVFISTDPNDKIKVGNLGYINIGGGTTGTVSFDDKYKTWDLTTKDNIHYPFTSKDCIKNVIAAQEQIPEAYIEQFIEEYNKGKVKDVEIEMEWRLGDTEDERYNLVPVYMPKLTDGFVIVIEKEISYTEEEVRELCKITISL